MFWKSPRHGVHMRTTHVVHGRCGGITVRRNQVAAKQLETLDVTAGRESTAPLPPRTPTQQNATTHTHVEVRVLQRQSPFRTSARYQRPRVQGKSGEFFVRFHRRGPHGVQCRCRSGQDRTLCPLWVCHELLSLSDYSSSQQL